MDYSDNMYLERLMDESNENFYLDLSRGILPPKTNNKKENKFNFQNIFGSKRNIKSSEYFNSDIFYYDIYEYFYKGGFMSILLLEITDILSFLFGTIFMIFILGYLDWERILKCGANNEIKDCGELYDYIYDTNSISILFTLTIILVCIIVIIKIFIFILNYKKLLFIHDFYKNDLKITSKDLQTMEWSIIINKISKHKKIKLTIQEITHKILRKENYFIALINQKILNISPHHYTKQLDFNLRQIILSGDINNIKLEKIKRKCILYGILNLVFSFFICMYIISHFLASNIDDFYSNKNIGLRRYSLLAKIKFRDYNELEHFFERRLNRSLKYCYEYIKQFPSPELNVVCKFIYLISGAFIGLFLILSILDESVLLYVHIFDRSLIFYTGIFGAVSTLAKSFIKQPENTIYNPSEIMVEKIYKHTHYMPLHWINKCNTFKIRDEFLVFFPYTINIFLQDLLSVFITPIILIFLLPKNVEDIIEFINTNTIHSDIGPICSFSTFENKTNDKKMSLSISSFNENHSIN